VLVGLDAAKSWSADDEADSEDEAAAQGS